jgi:glycosyltransferase involved in cell wall biosynthesis
MEEGTTMSTADMCIVMYLLFLSSMSALSVGYIFIYSPWILFGMWIIPLKYYYVMVMSLLLQHFISPWPFVSYCILLCFLHHGTKNRRILMTGDAFHPKVDGVSTFNQNVIEELISRDWNIQILTALPGPMMIHGARTYRSEIGIILPDHPSHVIGFLTPNMIWELIQFRPHVVHVWEGYGILSSQMILLCVLLGIPCVTSIHTKVYEYAKIKWTHISEIVIIFILWIYGQCIFRLTSNNFVVSLVENEYVPRPILLSSGVDRILFDSTRYSSVDVRKKLGLDKDRKLILHVGRLHHEKRVHDMIPIFKRVQEEIENVTFVVVGDGVEKESLKKECDLAGLSTVFCGNLFGEDLAGMYASCDVFFSPSDTEAFGLVFMEAMSCGLIPVGVRASAIRTLFEEGIHGFKYTVSDIEDAVQCLLRVLRLPMKNRMLMKDSGIALARQHSWKATVDILEKTYIGKGNVCKDS